MRTASFSTFCRKHVLDEVDRINSIELDSHEEYGCGVKTVRRMARAVVSKAQYMTRCETCYDQGKKGKREVQGEYIVSQE